MIIEQNKAAGLNIAYIGGGSRGWAWTLMNDLAGDGQLSGNVNLYDLDFQAAKNNEIIGNLLTARSEVKGKWHYKAVESLKEALKAADFVVISILPGTFDEMESDVHAPEEYGIYQSVGDTVGPGGIVRALRTVPMYVEIAESIKQYAPEAWVINYTNPMSICTQALYEIFPGIKAFGCCHEVFSVQKLLADILKEMKGIRNIDRNDIKINVLGLNHFTWFDNASYDGMDLFPLYRKFVDEHYEEGYINKIHQDEWRSRCFSSANRVKFDLFKRYGLIAAAGDRHLAEFCPPWYLKDPETASEWKFGLTPVSWRKSELEEKLKRSSRLVSGEEKIELSESGEEGIAMIKALLGLGDLVSNVNLPNKGQINGFPKGAVVETNAVFSRNSIRPVMAGQLPNDIHSLVLRHVINQETTIKAALSKDAGLAFRAFANDPLVTLNLGDAKKLFKKMLDNTVRYLVGWSLEI